jgi:hypothetical protein
MDVVEGGTFSVEVNILWVSFLVSVPVVVLTWVKLALVAVPTISSTVVGSGFWTGCQIPGVDLQTTRHLSVHGARLVSGY